MGKRLLLLGGGHAHMVTLANIRTLRSQGHEVTVIQPDEYQPLILRDGPGIRITAGA